jgi:hypothetical protein
MGAAGGPKIPTNSLSLVLDATNPLSAPSAGGAWYDLSGLGRTTDVYGSPGIATLGGARCYNLFTTGDRFVANFGSDQYTNNLTFEAWIYPALDELTSGDRGAIIQGYAYLSWNKSNQRMSSYWYSTTNQGYHEPNLQMTRGTWNHIVSVWNASTQELYQYINGTLQNTVSTYATSGFYYASLNLGWEGDSRQFSGGFGMIKIYNGALSGDEVSSIYNQFKSRFGR